MAVAEAERRPASARSQFLPRLLRSKIALAGSIVLTLVVIAAIAAPWITPYDPAEIHLINRL